MPRPPEPLPDEWADAPFRVRDARRLGIGRDRLKAPALHAPFNTVRDHVGRLEPARIAAAFALRQNPDQVVSHTTALLLLGAPLPRRIERQPMIHVSSVGASRPRTRLTIPHLLQPERVGVTTLGGLAITDPATSWVQSAPLLGLDDLVAAGDFLITGTEPFDARPPLIRREHLAAAVERHAGGRGVRKAREALGLVRYGPLSRRESYLHLMVLRAGLPELSLNFDVYHPTTGAWIAMVDGAHPEFRTAIEYESLLHLDPAKFRRDIRKQQELATIGWETHRLTSDDVDPQLRTPASRAAVARIRATLLARSWHPPRE
jgi:hypothetical protein